MKSTICRGKYPGFGHLDLVCGAAAETAFAAPWGFCQQLREQRFFIAGTVHRRAALIEVRSPG